MKRHVVARIDEARCIGCTRCIEACPVDAIVGARQLMHTVVDAWCIGCRLCVPPCPVDCIELPPAPREFAAEDKAAISRRAGQRKRRLAREPFVAPPVDRKAVIAALLAGRKQ